MGDTPAYSSGAGTSFIADIANSAVNNTLNTAGFIYNIFSNERNFNYQKQLQKEIFSREDTAFQRRLSDVTSAGFSPLAALGSSAGSGGSVSVSPRLSPVDSLNLKLGMAAIRDNALNSAAQRDLMSAQAANLRSQTAERDYNKNWYENVNQPTNAGMWERVVSSLSESIFNKDAYSLTKQAFDTVKALGLAVIEGGKESASKFLDSLHNTTGRSAPRLDYNGLNDVEISDINSIIDSGESGYLEDIKYPDSWSLKERQRFWKKCAKNVLTVWSDLSYNDMYQDWLERNPYPTY